MPCSIVPTTEDRVLSRLIGLLMGPIPEAHLLTVFIWKAIGRLSFDGYFVYLPHLHTSGSL